MADVTQLLAAIECGQAQATEELLPLVYDELRRLARQKLADERAGHTLEPTALVHEAYLRLVGAEGVRGQESGVRDQESAKGPIGIWNSRGHFFAAAAEAMRRILVEQARARNRLKRGRDSQRADFDDSFLIADDRINDVLSVHDALDDLSRHDAQAATLVKLRFYAGFGHQEAAEILGLSRREADGLWLLARNWLIRTLKDNDR
jgi:DNA-directed RNA polymerase specialized sigma24 family protein